MVTCENKAWSWQDVFRGIIAGAFAPEGGTPIQQRALKLVVVEDSGEPYFCPNKKFSGIDQLAKELTGLYSEDAPETALRVSIGTLADGPDMCSHPSRGYSEEQMMLSVIGKGVDGKPVVRLAAEAFVATDPDPGSGSGV